MNKQNKQLMMRLLNKARSMQAVHQHAPYSFDELNEDLVSDILMACNEDVKKPIIDGVLILGDENKLSIESELVFDGVLEINLMPNDKFDTYSEHINKEEAIKIISRLEILFEI